MATPSLPKPLGRLPADEHPHRAGVFGLSPAPASVGLARRNVRELLGEWGTDPETCDNAVLVTSELVTNALTHTASEWIVCRLRTDGHRLHLEVEDQNRGLTLPAQRSAGPDDQGGRGLMLVGMLSSDWGVRDAAYGSGRVVWAVLPSRQTLSPPPSTPRELAASGLAPTPHLTRPAPHSAEGLLPHGTAARP
ncbi:ATP-binding protein [Streptomyces sp. BV286]|nr:ATP-binding protein [Streptomyces sp. BV286]